MPRVKESPPPSALALRFRVELDDHVSDLDWSPDRRKLAVVTASGSLFVLDAGSGETRLRPSGHVPSCDAVAFSSDGGVLASAGQDGVARLHDPESGKELAVLQGGSSWVEHLAWQPGHRRLATASGKYLRLWDAEGRQLLHYADHPVTIADIAWNRQGTELASITYGFLSLFGVEKEGPLRQFPWRGSMLKLAWSPDGKQIATGNQDGTVQYFLLHTKKDLQMSGYDYKVRELAWDESGRYLATGGGPVVTIWDTTGKGPEGSRPIQLSAHKRRVSDLSFAHKGPLLASGGEEGDVVLWFLSGKVGRIQGVYSLGSGVSRLKFSPSDHALAVGTERGSVALLNLT